MAQIDQAAPQRAVDTIVIHCAATANGNSLFRGRAGEAGFMPPVEVIDEWHRNRQPPFRRLTPWRPRFNPTLPSVGYHFVIYTSGAVATGRHLDEIGAHVAGANGRSIGVCMIGTDRFTPAQWVALKACLEALAKHYGGTLVPKPSGTGPHRQRGALFVCGHRDYSPDFDGDGVIEPWEFTKICPGFDVARWLAGGMAPLAGHVLEDAA